MKKLIYIAIIIYALFPAALRAEENSSVMAVESSLIAGEYSSEKTPYWNSVLSTVTIKRQPVNEEFEAVTVSPALSTISGSGLMPLLLATNEKASASYIYHPEARAGFDINRDVPLFTFANIMVSEILQEGSGVIKEGEWETPLPVFNNSLFTIKGEDPYLIYKAEILTWQKKRARMVMWQSDEFSFESEGNQFTMQIAGFIVHSEDRRNVY